MNAARTAILALLLPAATVFGMTPTDFGLAEYRRVLEERKLNPKLYQVSTELSMFLPHDGFSIMGNLIRGGSQRGIMYGLLEAADEIRRLGHLWPAKVEKPLGLRGIRRFVHNAEMDAAWYHDREQWRAYFEMLARNRFNRFNLVFAHQTEYLAPPYPFLVGVAEYPQVRARGLSEGERQRNLESLKYIAQTASEYGIDFTLGIWEQDVQRGMTPSVDGLTPETLGPYTYQALKALLQACPMIRSVQVRTNEESGIPAARQVEFFRNYVFRALAEAGHLVQLDLRGWLMSEGLQKAALSSGVPVRLSSKYWAEHLGRPYQPAETFANYSFLNFLERPGVSDRPREYGFYWEVWALGSHRLLLWGDPDYVRRAVPTFALSGSDGFEIDAPLAQKGFGNRPGSYGVFDASQSQRVFWKYDWERYWLFYLLWGRLSYNPAEPERVWMDEFQRRFGSAAKDVFEAVRQASRVLNEVVATHMPDPNMYVWPEINPGGPIDDYIKVRPSDWRMVASFEEHTRNRLEATPSARQTPLETAEHLHEYALLAEQATARAEAALGGQNREWLSTKPDLDVLALLARYHGRKQMAGEHLAWYNATKDDGALYAARRELQGGLNVWQRLVKLTDGLYPAQMAYGPKDTGHWKDKLAEVEGDVKTLEARVEALEQAGATAPPVNARRWQPAPPRPPIEHTPARQAAAGKPLELSVRIWPQTGVRTVRLHYRSLNQMAQWKTLEAPVQQAVFHVPAEEIDARWDLQYYFEVLAANGAAGSSRIR